ncbi:hypothetical protein J2Y41_002287 [Arthrobacter sp. 1088]|uniref:hypothetical protein n=1 Tax=Arthrobacter sp. 1088 TaxID=2817768 RepID=UPI0028569D61|nr:hypothetical protein [Arthrobacter sp. 1088]MDR6686726.1 hypothetical protein [Arthrobacter sp. 1088]
MSEDTTPPRDDSTRDKGEAGVPPAPKVPPTPPQAPGQQPKQPSGTQPEASGLQPDPAPDLDPDFVPNPSDQPDPALPPDSGQPEHSDQPEYPGQPQYPGQPTGPYQPGDPYQPAGPYQPRDPAQDLTNAPHGDPVKRQRFVIGAIVVGVLVLIGVVIWVLLNLLGTRPEAVVTTPSPTASLGPLPRDTEAKDFQVGDCFADFDPNAPKARAVPCDTEHSAQLGAVHIYPADDSFPGTNALKDKGREVCGNVKLNHEVADKYVLLQQNVYPSTTSWDRGDRRVDCFIVVDSGNTIKEDLLNR